MKCERCDHEMEQMRIADHQKLSVEEYLCTNCWALLVYKKFSPVDFICEWWDWK